MKKIFSVLILSLISACSLGSKEPSPFPALYDFGPSRPALAGEAPAGLAGLSLDVRMPLWLSSSTGIPYRLLYQDRLRVYEYAAARWVGTPSGLVRQRLWNELSVSSAQSAALASCQIRVDLNEFVQVFSRPEQSYGLLSGEVRLLGKGNQVIAMRPFRFEKPATTQDASGGVAALASGLDSLAEDISDWLRHLPEEARAAACQGVQNFRAR